MDEIVIFKKQLNLVDLERVLALEPQVDIPLSHAFMGGVYVRSIFVPAGTIIIGKRHRHETCNMLLHGEMSIYMGEDIPTKRIVGPLLFKSEPGAKKMGYAHTDVIFLNIHPTNETDLQKIEDEFIIPEAEYELQQAKLITEGQGQCLGQQ